MQQRDTGSVRRGSKEAKQRAFAVIRFVTYMASAFETELGL